MWKFQRIIFPLVSYDDSDDNEEVQEGDSPAASVSKYPVQTAEEFFFSCPFAETEADTKADPSVRKM